MEMTYAVLPACPRFKEDRFCQVSFDSPGQRGIGVSQGRIEEMIPVTCSVRQEHSDSYIILPHVSWFSGGVDNSSIVQLRQELFDLLIVR